MWISRMARGISILPRFYDKIIYFNYIKASQNKEAVATHATSVLKFNGISYAPASNRSRSHGFRLSGICEASN